MPARVLFIGLDAAEATLLERWAAQGRLPALRVLSERGAAYRLDNCWDTLPTAVWPELTTGRSAERIALYFPPGQLRTGEAEPRRVEAHEVDPSGFWTIASDAGLRVASVDLPWTLAPPRLNGIFLGEWGTHDRWFGTSSFPVGLAGEVRARHGEYPVGLCDDDYGDSASERERLAADLVRAVEHETRLLCDLLSRDEWDLFACAFGQFQCVGHNFWRYLDATEGSVRLREAMPDVYAKVDEGVRAVREAAGPDAVSVVVVSHGMGPLVGGPQLLQEVIVRLGAGSAAGRLASVRSRLPVGLREVVRRVLPSAVRRPLQHAAGSLPAPLTSAATTAVSLPADVNGYIRLNLRGREPNGSVEPGREAEAVLADLRDALLELEQPASGERIVRSVISADEAFGADRHPDVPDLMVSFRTDIGSLDECVSNRVGLVRLPARIAHRSGDHTGEARLWLAGPGIDPQPDAAVAHALDVAPTVLGLLGVDVPTELDGRPLTVG